MLLGQIVSFFLLLAAVYCSIDASPRTAANSVSIMVKLPPEKAVWRYEMITQRGLDQSLDDEEGWRKLCADYMRTFGEKFRWLDTGSGGPTKNPMRMWWLGTGKCSDDNRRHPMDIYGWTEEQYDAIKAGIPGLTDGEDATEDIAVLLLEGTMLNGYSVGQYAEEIVKMKERLGDQEEVLVPRRWMTRKQKDGVQLPDDQQEELWWFQRLDPIGKALVKSVNSWKHGATSSTLYAKIVAHLKSKGLCTENEVKYEAFLKALGDNETYLSQDSYVTDRLLRAAGVPQSAVPLEKQVPITEEEFVAYMKTLFDKCDFNKELDVLTELQRQMVNLALQNLDLVEQYWLATHPNPAYAYLMKLLHDIFPCDCASCKRKLVSFMLCELDHIDREIKKEFTFSTGEVKNPSRNSADELWEQVVAGALQILCQEAHRDKDLSKLALILANVIANVGPGGGQLYSQRKLNNHKYLNAFDEERYEGRCLFSGKFFTPQTIYTDEGEVVIPPEWTAHRDQHHVAGDDDVVRKHPDGSEKLRKTAKKECISNIARESSSNADFQERIKELLKVRPVNCIEHDLFHYIIKRPDLLWILCVVIPWERRPAVKDANGKVLRPGQIVVPSAWQEELPSILEPEIEGVSKEAAREVREQRLCDFFAEIGHDAGAENPFAHHLVEGRDLHDLDFDESLAKMQSNVEVDESDDESDDDAMDAEADLQGNEQEGNAQGPRRSPRFAGEQSDAIESSSQPPVASASSDGQSMVEQSESVSSDAPSMEKSALEETSSDSMDVESLDSGDVSFEGSISSLDESSPSPPGAPPAVPAAEAPSAVVESSATAEAVESIAASSPPTPALDMRHLVESNHVFCTIDKSSTSASLGEVRLVATPAGSIEVHSVGSDGQSQRIGHLLGSSEHHTIIKLIGWLPVEVTATLTAIGRFGSSSICVEYHSTEGVSPVSALEELTRLLNVSPLPPTPECGATHASPPSSSSSDPLSHLKSMAVTPASTPHLAEERQLMVRVRVEGMSGVQNVAGQMVRLVPGTLSIDVVKLKEGAFLGHVLGAPSHFQQFLQELCNLPFTISDAQILRRAEYVDTYSLRVHISSKSNVSAPAAFGELGRLFGEHCCLEEVKSQKAGKRKRGT